MPKILKRNICMRDCYDRCYFYSEVENNTIKKVWGAKEHPITRGFLCPKGYSLPRLINNERRLLKPLVKDNNSWKEITIEEAINLIADTIKKSKKERSYFLSYAGNMGLVESYALRAFFDMIGFNIVVPNLCSTSGNKALMEVFGTYNGADVEDIINRKLIVIWGMNASWTNVHGMRLILDAVRNGAKLYLVDPNKTATAKVAHKHFRIRPGSDIFFALGIAKYIVLEELYDKNFVKKNFLGYEEYFKLLEEIKWEEIEHLTGINFETIKQFAYDYATITPNWIHIGYGFQRRIGGGDIIKAISYLPVLIGDSSAFYYDFSINIDLEASLGINKSQRITFSDFYNIIKEGGADFIFIMSMNPVYTVPESLKFKQLLEKDVEYVVVYDVFMTETAMAADLVIPSTMFVEVEDIALSYFHRYLGFNEKAVDPPKGVIDAFSLAKRLSDSLNIEFPWKSREHFITSILEVMGIDYEELKRKWFIKIDKSLIDEAQKAVYTPFISLNEIINSLKKQNNNGDFEFMVLTYHSSISSQYSQVLPQDNMAYMNTEDAKTLGLNSGDEILIYNENGKIKCRVVVTDDIHRGTIVMYKGARLNGENLSPNALVQHLIDSYGVVAYHSTRVRVRKL